MNCETSIAALSSTSRCWIRVGAISGALAVIFGAFGAHGLGDVLVEKYSGQTDLVLGEKVSLAVKYMDIFNTAAEYQMSHSLAILAVGLLAMFGSSRAVAIAGWSFLAGIVLFSGSLYLLVLTGQKWLGAITPIGGVLFIVGWIALACAFCCRMKTPSPPAN